jgi:hypothetical protein
MASVLISILASTLKVGFRSAALTEQENKAARDREETSAVEPSGETNNFIIIVPLFLCIAIESYSMDPKYSLIRKAIKIK